MPHVGKAAIFIGAAIGVAGTLAIGRFAHIEPEVLAVSAESSALSNEVIRPIDQIALAEGEHDRVILLDVPSQYDELAGMLGFGEFRAGFSGFATDDNGVPISAANHWTPTELPTVRAQKTDDGDMVVEPVVEPVRPALPAGWNPSEETTETTHVHRGIFANQIYLFARANLTVTALPGDVVVAGDWDGDGNETDGVIRTVEFGPLSPTQGVFLATDGNGGLEQPRIFIDEADEITPLVGDWDGDGADSLAIRRAQTEDAFAPDVVEFFDNDGEEMSEPLEVNSAGVIVVGDAEIATRFVRLRSSR